MAGEGVVDSQVADKVARVDARFATHQLFLLKPVHAVRLIAHSDNVQSEAKTGREVASLDGFLDGGQFALVHHDGDADGSTRQKTMEHTPFPTLKEMPQVKQTIRTRSEERA